MKNIEESMKSALFRAEMMKQYKSDPGPNWDQGDSFHYLIVGIVVLLMLNSLFSS
jgi:hypothetical protein